MDDELVPIVEQQHDDLQQVARQIGPQPQLTARPALTLVRQRVGDQEPSRRMERVLVGDAVSACRPVHVHRIDRNTKLSRTASTG
jgi:hypothetical protein